MTGASGPPSLTGLFAAAVTPRTAAGAVDHVAFDRVLDLLLAAGVDGVCLGGATAEYPHASRDERLDLIARTAARIGNRALLVGIGAAAPTDVVPLGRAALEAGARAVLLSMPLFFPYAQEDLEAFCVDTAAAIGGPVLLYDLPSFTTPLATDTVLSLLGSASHVIGIKDSSGQRDRLVPLTTARGDQPWRLLVGDDAMLVDAMAAGWDGCISGTSGAFPELMLAVTRAARARDEATLAVLVPLLKELFVQQGVFPTPWGIRIGLEARGIGVGPLPLPLSPGRRAQKAAYMEWVPDFLARVEGALGLSLVGAR
jgi:4-hydroxy-tetrahydrodipicolinate synthase